MKAIQFDYVKVGGVNLTSAKEPDDPPKARIILECESSPAVLELAAVVGQMMVVKFNQLQLTLGLTEERGE